MASVKKSVLMEYLRCTLCMEDMERSCILQCHHSFCVDCLQKYMKTATDPQKMTCPICRKVTTLPGGDLTNLPPNFFVDNLKELITKETDGDEDEMTLTASAYKDVAICSLEDCQGGAVMYCTVCQEYLCQTCTDEHAGHRLTRKHQTIPAAEAKDRMTPSTQSHHPCGRHPNQMLDTYCKTCEEIICHECFNTEHNDHNFTTLRPFVKPCEERLNILLKRIDKLLKCVDLARQTSLQQLDKAQHHIVSLKTQVTTTFTQIREKLTHQEERLMSDLNRAETRVNKVASSIQDEQQLAEVNLKSQCYLGQSLLRGDVYDQISNLPSLEEAVEKRWTTEIPGVVWTQQCLSLAQSVYHAFIHSFIYSLVRLYVHTYVCWFVHLFFHSLVLSFVRTFVRSYLRMYVRLFSHSPKSLMFVYCKAIVSVPYHQIHNRAISHDFARFFICTINKLR